MIRPEPPRYRTTNGKTNNAALKSRGVLTIWFDRDMQWLAQATGFVHSLLQLSGLEWPVPDYTDRSLLVCTC